ncbi:MAG: rRNA maturation RNase YbeY [Gammaproteobacteria bacterium]|nr:rRNA maturation RNase YbeY [Gammaproteobacteria bacterium]
MISVILLNEIQFGRAPTEVKFQQWIDQTVNVMHEQIPSSCKEICISIIDTETSAHLNETYRQKKGATNVLSFVYESMPGVIQESLGDLAICAELVESEAKVLEQTLEAHWAHLTIHGILHLLGYDHMIEAEAKIMETLEVSILQQLGFKDPYL